MDWTVKVENGRIAISPPAKEANGTTELPKYDLSIKETSRLRMALEDAEKEAYFTSSR